MKSPEETAKEEKLAKIREYVRSLKTYNKPEEETNET